MKKKEDKSVKDREQPICDFKRKTSAWNRKMLNFDLHKHDHHHDDNDDDEMSERLHLSAR